MAMAINKERLMELRVPIVFILLLAAALFTLLRLGPSFSTVINFFCPLLVSTAFFLAAVAVLLRISPPPSDTPADRAGEEIMDYVAGQPQPQPQPQPQEVDGSKDGEAEADHRKSE